MNLKKLNNSKMKMTTNDYIVYKDSTGDYGCAKESFYHGALHLTNKLKIFNIRATEEQAKRTVQTKNVPSGKYSA
jgi:hypothetical protein